MGVPRNVIARWLSETKDPDVDFAKLKKIPRSISYNYNIVNLKGKIWNIEYTSQRAVLVNPSSPYVHTNHYLSELKHYEMNDNSGGTFDRYEVAKTRTKSQMTISELMDLSNDKSREEIIGIMNEGTIGRIVIDLNNLIAKIWLCRENDKGWIDYKLDDLFGW